MNSPAASATAAIFDMDGTLVDNMAYHIAAWEAFCDYHRLPFSLDYYYQNLNGRTAKDTLYLLFGRVLDPEEIHRLTEQKEELYRELYRPHIQPLAGVVGFLESLQRAGVKCAVATSAPWSNVSFTLEGAGLAPYFDVVVYGGMVQRGKPDPEIYLTTAARLGIAPARCVVFEDALLGIEAARRAAMPVVGITTSHSAEELKPLTVSQLTDFEGLSFTNLASWIS